MELVAWAAGVGGREVNRTEYLLACLAEEAVEVAQRATKAMRFGCDEVQPGQELSNTQRIRQELSDLIAVAEMLEEAGVPVLPLEVDAIDRKKAKVAAFMEYSRSCGTLS